MPAGLGLGAFGDARLEKRGPICWSRWCPAATYAFGEPRRVNDGRSLDLVGS